MDLEGSAETDWTAVMETNHSLSLNHSLSAFQNGTEDDLDLDNFDPHVIFYPNPEEMRNPAKRNPLFYPIVITHSVTLIVGILGNLIAVFVMVGDRKTRNATNLFLVSLAVADLLLLLLCVPLEMLQYFLQFDDNGFICKTAKYVLLLSATASVLNLCAVSLERFIVIVFPMQSRSLCTLSNCRKAIILVWISATVLSMPVILIKDGYVVTFTNNITSVRVYYCEEAVVDLPFAVYQFVILFAAPGLLMMICYIYVIRELWKSTRNINLLMNTRSVRGLERRPKKERRASPVEESEALAANIPGRVTKEKNLNPESTEKLTKHQKSDNSPSQLQQSQTPQTCRRSVANPVRNNREGDVKRARKQVIKMLILVIVLFLICWGPKLMLAITLKLAAKFDLELYTPSVYNIRFIFNLIPFVHSCFNPVIYSFMSKNFRRSFTRQLSRIAGFCGCTCACAKNSTSTTRNDIPLRAVINRTRKTNGQEGTAFSSNYYSVSEAASTRHTEVHGISTI